MSKIQDTIKIKINTDESQAEVKESVRQSTDLKIKDEVGLVQATSLLIRVKSKIEALEADQKSWLRPLKEYIKRIQDHYYEFLNPLDEMKDSLERAILQYRSKQAERAAKQLEKETKKLTPEEKRQGVVPTVQEPLKTVDTFEGSLTASKVWDYELVDIRQVPDGFLELNRGAVRTAINAGTREIPGLKIFQKEILSTKKVAQN